MKDLCLIIYLTQHTQGGQMGLQLWIYKTPSLFLCNYTLIITLFSTRTTVHLHLPHPVLWSIICFQPFCITNRIYLWIKNLSHTQVWKILLRRLHVESMLRWVVILYKGLTSQFYLAPCRNLSHFPPWTPLESLEGGWRGLYSTYWLRHPCVRSHRRGTGDAEAESEEQTPLHPTLPSRPPECALGPGGGRVRPSWAGFLISSPFSQPRSSVLFPPHPSLNLAENARVLPKSLTLIGTGPLVSNTFAITCRTHWELILWSWILRRFFFFASLYCKLWWPQTPDTIY